MSSPSRFVLAAAATGAAASLLVLAARAADGVPPPVEPAPLVYPYDLALAGTEGSATVQFNIDAEGYTRDVTVVDATQPAFGHAAKGMIEAERFAPRIENGKPVVQTGLKQEVRFTRDSLDAGAQAMIAELKKPQPDFAKAKELDKQPPPLLKAVKPVYPQSLMGSTSQNEAVIECIIDSTGHVQLPRIISATTEDCGWAAATAVSAWEFAPPTKGGRTVATRMRIPLEFVPPKAEAAAGQ